MKKLTTQNLAPNKKTKKVYYKYQEEAAKTIGNYTSFTFRLYALKKGQFVRVKLYYGKKYNVTSWYMQMQLNDKHTGYRWKTGKLIDVSDSIQNDLGWTTEDLGWDIINEAYN